MSNILKGKLTVGNEINEYFKERIEEIEKELIIIKAADETMAEAIKNLETINSNISNDLSDTISEVNKLKEEDTKINNKINDLENELSTAKDNLESVTTKTVLFEKDIESINKNLENIRDNITEIENDIIVINENITSLELRVINLESRINQAEDQIMELKDADDKMAQDILEAKEIAKGRSTGYVFDTVDSMNQWLANEDNKSKLVTGDNLYIIDTDVPDYWWDGNQVQELETQKVDLSQFYDKSFVYTKVEVNNLIDSVFRDVMEGEY